MDLIRGVYSVEFRPWMPTFFSTVCGQWKGGFNNNVITIEIEKTSGVCKGSYKGSKGGIAGFEGKMIEGGKKLLGFW